jgi:hypothetical protein
MGNNIHVEDKKMLSNFLNSVESEIINEIEHHTSLNKLIKKLKLTTMKMKTKNSLINRSKLN